jgi:FlaA1/EpsC-like NDP-sugar epimerase
VLITGAGGCIGSALATAVAQSGPGELVLLDSSESALYDIHQALDELKDAPPHIPALASVCDVASIHNLFKLHRPEIVFHAAAFKHVPLMERHPFAAVANNALGTQILVEAAAEYGCQQLVMVSTDKAVAPSSIMGASKRIAELVLLASRPQSTCMKIVRLGNVLGSSGSVVPLFERQIASGGPVTVAHPDVRRYFMTVTEAVETLLDALSSDADTGVLVPELGEPIRVLDLAKFLIGPQNDVPIVFTELRPGDKMKESLLSERESYGATRNGSLRTIHTPALSLDELSASLQDLRIAIEQRHLSSLLQTVQRMVPEYQPSTALAMHLHTESAVNV